VRAVRGERGFCRHEMRGGVGFQGSGVRELVVERPLFPVDFFFAVWTVGIRCD
jgi:hypothetical protein